MINQVVANPDYTSSSNQYGFYALPKTLKPKTKYRQENKTEYQEEQQSNHEENFIVPLQQPAEDQRNLERDYFVDEAPYPEFKPKERGSDYAVQVQDRQLFDFQLEVEPLLQILVGQSILKARNELQQQMEIADNKRKLTEFEKKRNAELMVTQRLENQNKRKQEQADRRKLQHNIYKEQKKLTLKKIISFDQSKRALANLRNQVLDDLESEGLLRHDMYLTLRTQYEPWLYEQIAQQLSFKSNVIKQGQELLQQKQRDLNKSHKKCIDQENQRRKQILDQRQKQRLENEERKRKKAIKKQRLALNKARNQKFEKLQEIVKKIEKLDHINKADFSDNSSKHKSMTYVPGGLFIHLVEIIAEVVKLKPHISDDQLDDLFVKLLSEMTHQLEVDLPATLREAILQLQSEMKENFIQFYKSRQDRINELVSSQRLSGHEYVSTFHIRIDPAVSKRILNCLLSIYFIANPPEDKQKEQEVPPETEVPVEPKIILSDRQKKRIAVKHNILLNFEDKKKLEGIKQIIRFRYPLRQQNIQQEEEPYIEVFDGEGWARKMHSLKRVEGFQDKQSLAINLASFDHAYVYDQISQHNVNKWILALLTEAGISLPKEEFIKIARGISKKYQQHLSTNKDIPIYDIEVFDESI